MKKGILNSFYILFLFLASCSKESINTEARITSFSFLKQNNPELTSNFGLEITDTKILGNLPFNASLDRLIATFEFDGTSIKIDNISQESNVTSNNFKEILYYTITAGDGTVKTYEADIIHTGLPIVRIVTENNEPIDSKEEYRNGDVEITGRGIENFNAKMKIRGRGNSTWWIGQDAKKPYQMKLKEKAEILGMPKDKKWIFLAEYSDKTLLRNRVAFELGHLSNLDWTPSSTFAEVIVNEEYVGTYHITQKVEESKRRVNIGDNGYLLEIDQLSRLDPDDVYFETSQFLINIKEPKLEKNDDQYNYITNYITQFETALYGANFKDEAQGYAKYIDVDSFIDWYLINEISKNQDAKSFSSIYMNMIPEEKLKMGPLWDFDLGFGNVNYSIAEQPTGFWIKYNPWIRRMFEDQNFVNKVKQRFAYYREKEDYILGFIDDYAIKLDRAQYENNQKWHTLGKYIWPNPVWFDTYNEEVVHLKNWITQRMDWLDKEYKDM